MQGRVDGDAGAEQGGDVFALQGRGNGDGKARVDADGVGVAAIATDAGGLRGGTEMFVALAAPLADAATVCLPADADALADGEVADPGAGGGDGADDLVAGDEGIAADAPVVVDEMNV